MNRTENYDANYSVRQFRQFLSVAKININKCEQNIETVLCLEFILKPLSIGLCQCIVLFYVLYISKYYFFFFLQSIVSRSTVFFKC